MPIGTTADLQAAFTRHNCIITRKESKHWCHIKQVLIRQITDTSTTLTGLQNRNTKRLHLYCTGGCDICLGDWGCSSGGVYVPSFFFIRMPRESYSRWLSSLLLCLCDLWGGGKIWLIEAVLLVESRYLVFISMPGKSYHSQLRSLLLCLCDIWALTLLFVESGLADCFAQDRLAVPPWR